MVAYETSFGDTAGKHLPIDPDIGGTALYKVPSPVRKWAEKCRVATGVTLAAGTLGLTYAALTPVAEQQFDRLGDAAYQAILGDANPNGVGQPEVEDKMVPLSHGTPDHASDPLVAGSLALVLGAGSVSLLSSRRRRGTDITRTVLTQRPSSATAIDLELFVNQQSPGTIVRYPTGTYVGRPVRDGVIRRHTYNGLGFYHRNDSLAGGLGIFNAITDDPESKAHQPTMQEKTDAALIQAGRFMGKLSVRAARGMVKGARNLARKIRNTPSAIATYCRERAADERALTALMAARKPEIDEASALRHNSTARGNDIYGGMGLIVTA